MHTQKRDNTKKPTNTPAQTNLPTPNLLLNNIHDARLRERAKITELIAFSGYDFRFLSATEPVTHLIPPPLRALLPLRPRGVFIKYHLPLLRSLGLPEPEETAEMALEEDQIVHVMGRGGVVGWAVVVDSRERGQEGGRRSWRPSRRAGEAGEARWSGG